MLRGGGIEAIVTPDTPPIQINQPAHAAHFVHQPYQPYLAAVRNEGPPPHHHRHHPSTTPNPSPLSRPNTRAGLNTHVDQQHLFGLPPAENHTAVLMMCFLDHTEVAATPQAWASPSPPPAFMVCDGTVLLMRGDTPHSTDLPPEFRGDRSGVQLRGWMPTLELDGFLASIQLGGGPSLGPLLDGARRDPGKWVAEGGSLGFLAVTRLGQEGTRLFQDSFADATMDASLAPVGHQPHRKLWQCGPFFDTKIPRNRTFEPINFPPFTENFVWGLCAYLQHPRFSVRGIFWQTFIGPPTTGINPKCLLCPGNPPPRLPGGGPGNEPASSHPQNTPPPRPRPSAGSNASPPPALVYCG